MSLLIVFPGLRHNYGNKNYVAAAQHLAALQKKGKVKHVGATNFDVPRLQEFVDAGVTIANNQVRRQLAVQAFVLKATAGGTSSVAGCATRSLRGRAGAGAACSCAGLRSVEATPKLRGWQLCVACCWGRML